MERPVNWGILSCGFISKDFAYALKLNCPNAVVYAVAARSQERANEFGEKIGAKKSYSSYEALAEDPDVGMLLLTASCLTLETLSMLARSIRNTRRLWLLLKRMAWHSSTFFRSLTVRESCALRETFHTERIGAERSHPVCLTPSFSLVSLVERLVRRNCTCLRRCGCDTSLPCAK